VVASDRYTARDALDAIVVDIDPLPAVVDPERAMTGQPTVIHPDFPNNLAVALVPSGTGVSADGKVDDSAIEKAFARPEIVISQRMINQRLVPNAMEPRAWSRTSSGKGSMTIWSSTQNPHILRTMIAAMTGLGQDQVRAVAPEVGGGFGAKINIYPEEYVAGRPSRSDWACRQMGGGSLGSIRRHHAWPRHHRVRGACRQARRQGARSEAPAHRRHRRVQHAPDGRHPDAHDDDGQRHLRHPRHSDHADRGLHEQDATDAYRGAGRPEASYFVERAMDMLARELNLDPAEVRRRNFIAPDKFPYATQMAPCTTRATTKGARPRAESLELEGARCGT